MSLEVLSIGSDNLVRLDALTNASSGAFVNNATVTFALKDSTGAVVGGLSAVSMPYVAASSGRYEGTLAASVSTTLTVNGLYFIEITATQGGTTLFRRVSCQALYRSSQ